MLSWEMEQFGRTLVLSRVTKPRGEEAMVVLGFGAGKTGFCKTLESSVIITWEIHRSVYLSRKTTWTLRVSTHHLVSICSAC